MKACDHPQLSVLRCLSQARLGILYDGGIFEPQPRSPTKGTVFVFSLSTSDFVNKNAVVCTLVLLFY
jgi:hypothetical protein